MNYSVLFTPLFVAALLLGPITTLAADVSVSGFGTLGVAQSDRSFAYQRFIDGGGSVKRDSVLGVQADALFSPLWSATAQLKMAPSLSADNRWEATLSWAFVSWRPSNGALLRFGKLRLPLYLDSENMDVGATFDFARLPAEIYSMTPTADFNGVSVEKTWELESGEMSLNAYWGKTRTHWREYFRNEVPGFVAGGAQFPAVDVSAQGIVAGYRVGDNVFRLGVHEALAERGDGQTWVDGPVLVRPTPGVAYYSLLPSAGVSSREVMHMPIVNGGFDVDLGHDFRLAGEYARRRVPGMDLGLNSNGGYLSLRRKLGAWTPYIVHSQLRSDSRIIDLYRTVNATRVAARLPTAAVINTSQIAIADALHAYDQNSWALGVSYAPTPTGKFKAEWMRTRLGAVPSLADSPPNEDISRKSIDVFSLSYSFIF